MTTKLIRGGKTFQLCHDYKLIGGGKTFQVCHDYQTNWRRKDFSAMS
jgi:hypothetical protein